MTGNLPQAEAPSRLTPLSLRSILCEMKHQLTDDSKIREIQSELLCCALEGGSNYWYWIDKFAYPKGKTRDSYQFAHLEVPFAKGGALLIYAEDHANPARKDKLWVLDANTLARGWKLMHDVQPRHYGDAIAGEFDADTGDVFLQLSLFGDVIFG